MRRIFFRGYYGNNDVYRNIPGCCAGYSGDGQTCSRMLSLDEP